MTLNELPSAGSCVLVVEALKGGDVLVERLHELGFFPGARLEVQGRLPLGGPWVVHLGATSFALRADEASALEVRKLA